jgi:endo-1,4-beta-xylanase
MRTIRSVLWRSIAIFVALVGLASDSRADSYDKYLHLQPIPDCQDAPVTTQHSLRQPRVDTLGLPWQVAGVQQTNGRLVLQPTNLAILSGSGQYLADPMWNGRNRFDIVTSDFSVVLQAQGTNLSLSIGSLPLVYDEFIFPRQAITITLAPSSLSVSEWNGVHAQPVVHTFSLQPEGADMAVQLRVHGGQLTLETGAQRFSVPIKEFELRQLWLGLEGSGVVSKLELSSSGGIVVQDMASLKVGPCHEGLRAVAAQRRPGFGLGTAIALAPLVSDRRYAALLASNFNLVTLENALKPQFTEPRRGIFTLQEAIFLATLIKAWGMQVHGHALVPNRSLPAWMANAPLKELGAIMAGHITGVVGGMGELIDSWDVINEALSAEYYGLPGQSPWRETIWYKAMGEDFVEKAFAAAHAANPKATLWINDFALDKDQPGDEARFQFLFNVLASLKQHGYNVGLGFEGHVYDISRDSMSASALGRRFQQLAGAGIKARVSEMDVTPKDASNAITAESLATQAQQFDSILRACLEAANCVAFSTWGIGGPYVSTADIDDQGRLRYTSHLLWDDELRQRPAYAAAHAALQAA